MFIFNNMLFNVILIIIIYKIINYNNYNGPCLDHCYKKYNNLYIIGILVLGYVIGKYYDYI